MHPEPRRAERSHDAPGDCCGACLAEVPARFLVCPRCAMPFGHGIAVFASVLEPVAPVAMGLSRARPAVAA